MLESRDLEPVLKTFLSLDNLNFLTSVLRFVLFRVKVLQYLNCLNH